MLFTCLEQRLEEYDSRSDLVTMAKEKSNHSISVVYEIRMKNNIKKWKKIIINK